MILLPGKQYYFFHYSKQQKGPERKSGPLKEVFVKRSIKNYISPQAEPEILMQTDQSYKQILVF